MMGEGLHILFLLADLKLRSQLIHHDMDYPVHIPLRHFRTDFHCTARTHQWT